MGPTTSSRRKQPQRLTCDCEIHRIVPTQMGCQLMSAAKCVRSQPTCAKHSKSAIKGCVFLGARNHRAGLTLTIIHWAQGGKTSLDNAAPLCSRHHHEVHANNHTVQVQLDGRATVTLNRRRL